MIGAIFCARFICSTLKLRDADVADLALLSEFREGRPAFFDFVFRVGPVDLVEVDGVDVQGGAASLGLFFERFGLERAVD